MVLNGFEGKLEVFIVIEILVKSAIIVREDEKYDDESKMSE